MPSNVARADYALIEELLRRRVGHELGEGKDYLIEGRLDSVARDFGLDGPRGVIARLRSHGGGALESAVIDALMTGETSFFRNPSTYMGIRRKVLPTLIAARRERRRLRIWSAGCSTGQEPYSLAFLLADDFPELADWDVSILATDVSNAALARARLGDYNETEVRRGLTANEIARHFEIRGERRVVSRASASRIEFRKHNLIDACPYRDEFDLILARNVLIYFAVEFKRETLRKLRSALREDGFLILGESETVLGLSNEFAYPNSGTDHYRPTAPGLEAV